MCSDECLDKTIEAAQKISQGCGGKCDLDTHKSLRTYAAWGNRDIAKWACADNDGHGNCYQSIFAAETQLANYEFDPSRETDPQGAKDRLKKNVCGGCIIKWVDLVKDNAYMTPILYYGDIMDPPALYQNLNELCSN